MKRFGALLFVVFLVACTEPTSTNGEDEPQPISFQVSGEPEETRVYNSLIEQYEDENLGVEVDLIEIADDEDHLAKLATDFSAGDPADVFLINYREYAQFVVRQAVEPLEELMTSRGLSIDDYYEQSMEAFTFDGELQCMPQNISSLVVYFNKKLFRQAGIDPPFEGWTFEEFRAAAEMLTRGDVHGVGIDPEIIRIAPFVWSNAGEITDDPAQPTRFTLEDPAAREVFEAIVSLVKEASPDEEEVAAQDLEARFINEKLGMILFSRVNTPVFREVLSLRWDVLPLPTFGEPAGILHSDAMCISAGSDAIDSAADFVAYAMQPDGQTTVALTGRTVPSLASVAESGAFLDPSQPPRHSQVWLDAIPTIRNTPVLSTWPEIEVVGEEIITKAFYEEGYTVDDAIRELDEQTRPLFEEAATR